MSDSKSLVAVPKLNGSNYHIWQFKMQSLLRSKGLWTLVSKGTPALTTVITDTPGSTHLDPKGKGKANEDASASSSSSSLPGSLPERPTEDPASTTEEVVATPTEKDEKALWMITATIDEGYDSRIRRCKTAHEAWVKLEKHFKKNNKHD